MTNIVSVKPITYGVKSTRPLYQYDYGQILQFTGLDLPTAYEVHFSNSETGEATPILGGTDGVLIPDEYLITGEDVHVWVFLHTGDSDGETVYHIIIPVIKRAEANHETPDPVQIDFISQTIAALNAAVEHTDEAIVTVNEYKERAETAAEDAEQSMQGAADSQTKAEQAREQTQLIQKDVADTYDQTLQAKVDAELARDDAYAHMRNAAQSSIDAANYSAGALASANDAYDAQTAAERAQSLAETAKNNAYESEYAADLSAHHANQSAIAASNSERNAEQSASAAEESAERSAAARDGIESFIDDAEQSANEADALRLQAEGHAKGTQNDVAVPSTSPYYEDNAKFYYEQAYESAQRSEDMAARSGYLDFYVTDEGHLIYQHTTSVELEFGLEEGRLIASWQTE